MAELNRIIAKKLNHISQLIKLRDKDNKFKARAYSNAAKIIRNLRDPVDQIDPAGLKGIGASLSKTISELIDSKGETCTKLKELEETQEKKISKKAKELISTLSEPLEPPGNHSRSLVVPYIDFIRNSIKQWPEVSAAGWVGSIRRNCTFINNADLLIITDDISTVLVRLEYFIKGNLLLLEPLKVPENPFTKSLKLRVSADITPYGAIGVNFFFSTLNGAGAAKCYLTGSKEHNEALRIYAKTKGILITEQTIRDMNSNRILGGAKETDIYRLLNLSWLPFELRETRKVPSEPPKGWVKKTETDLNIHSYKNLTTTLRTSVLRLAKGAKKLGYHTIAITDHGHSLRFKAVTAIDELKKECAKATMVSGVKVLAGMEVSIGVEGVLEFPQPRLQQLDWVVASLHKKPDYDIENRILSAIYNPVVKQITNVTGRKAGVDLGDEVDWSVVFKAAAKHRVAIGINSHPEHIDMDWPLIELAAQHGCKFSICSGAYSVEQLSRIQNGILIARKAWLAEGNLVVP